MAKLHEAVLEGDLKTIKYLMSTVCEIDEKDVNGNTPIHYACYKGYRQIVKYLIQHGACLNFQNNQKKSLLMITLCGETCKRRACKKRKEEVYAIIKLLLKEKCKNINSIDHKGNTALHVAVERATVCAVKRKCISLLIQHGADAEIVNHKQQTAYDIAKQNQVIQIQELFWYGLPCGVNYTSSEIKNKDCPQTHKDLNIINEEVTEKHMSAIEQPIQRNMLQPMDSYGYANNECGWNGKDFVDELVVAPCFQQYSVCGNCQSIINCHPDYQCFDQFTNQNRFLRRVPGQK
ncbi:serine/threonine-protein phosphatase 6 regulatory ankyrin repeat subunit B-like [Hydractinia symbiolongicarpus]|uniref:serine/threonine-protein phosphatase 6 regulatory ankyrin repeat subunit B-like n=1 Tax=Hydractinia symbiolongicarpus TaxID=13093 RepID=UPI0025508101|nr:serine/threonine-protein phosphatase 6 regulatory ankyrin repeat subunit B-like [Hydractinia symbiolongicarpus]